MVPLIIILLQWEFVVTAMIIFFSVWLITTTGIQILNALFFIHLKLFVFINMFKQLISKSL